MSRDFSKENGVTENYIVEVKMEGKCGRQISQTLGEGFTFCMQNNVRVVMEHMNGVDVTFTPSKDG